MKWENTLIAHEEDIRNRSFWDWMKAHTSGFKPLHRHEGVLELSEENVVFRGRDIRKGEDFNLEIPVRDIRDVYLGWDEVFTGFPMSRAGDRAYPWNKPLRLRYKSDHDERTLYLFARFHRRWGIRASDNKEVFEKLRESLDR